MSNLFVYDRYQDLGFYMSGFHTMSMSPIDDDKKQLVIVSDTNLEIRTDYYDSNIIDEICEEIIESIEKQVLTFDVDFVVSRHVSKYMEGENET